MGIQQDLDADVDLTAEYITNTSEAILLDFTGEDDAEGMWIPLSQVIIKEEIHDLEKGNTVNITMPEWLAINKRLV